VTKLLENLSFFINLVNFICLLKEVTYVNSFDRNDLFGLFVLCAEYLAKASLPYHLTHLVLVNNLAHVKGAPLCFQVKCVTILQKINVVLANLKATQAI